MNEPASLDSIAPPSCTVFDGHRQIASGPLTQVVAAAKQAFDRGGSVLIVSDADAQVVDVDYSGTEESVLARLRSRQKPPVAGEDEESAPRGRGRPRLGVVAREVTLLPRHWDWLSRQPGGASVALRRLVDEARRTNAGKDRVRRSQETAYRFMSALGGDLPGFEEAMRALFAGDRQRFDTNVAGWPEDLRTYSTRLAADALAPGTLEEVRDGR